MQNLIKQSRARFSAKTQESSSFKDRQIPPQNTQSFKEEKKRGQNWFQRQFSGQMSQSYDFNNGIEKIVAVAAAAYVIDSIEESSIRDQRKIDEGPHPSFNKPKSRKEEATISTLQDDEESKKVSGKDSIRSSEHAGSKVPIATATEEKGPAKAASSAPSTKKTTTFSDRQLERTNTFPSRTPSKPDLPSTKPINPDVTTIKQESGATNADMSTIKNGSAAQKTDIRATKPDQPQAIKRGTQISETQKQSSRGPAIGETEASTWETAQMVKIKERYQKLNGTISEWEHKKKTKAKSKLHKTEGELEQRRAEALKKFQNEMEYIKQVVEGARAQAEKRQRNDELKVRQKANVIRTTGRVPRTCFCL
ncbi:hypothetical protein SLE2022_263730 [Rubroshorea leprosula]